MCAARSGRSRPAGSLARGCLPAAAPANANPSGSHSGVARSPGHRAPAVGNWCCNSATAIPRAPQAPRGAVGLPRRAPARPLPRETRVQPVEPPLCRVRDSRGMNRGRSKERTRKFPSLSFRGAFPGCKPQGCLWDVAAENPGLQGAYEVMGKYGGVGEDERKDGVFDAHSNAGRRGPQVGEGKRTGSQDSHRERGTLRLRPGQRGDEAESRKTRVKNTKRGRGAGLMEGTAGTSRDSVAKAPGGARTAPLNHSSGGDRVFVGRERERCQFVDHGA